MSATDMPDRHRTWRELRVAMLAPISWRVPPRHYGPWEQFVSLLTEGLVERGVDVTLFATADSITSADARRHGAHGLLGGPRPSTPRSGKACTSRTVFERADEFDLIHNNFDFLPLTYSGLVETPVVTTIHGFSSERIVPVFERYDGRTSLRRDQRRRPPRPASTYAATIHHGIDMAAFPLGEAPEDSLLFFGRIHPGQGRRGSDRGRRARRHAAHDRRASCRTPTTSPSASSRTSTGSA